jgi:hypothetical protein
LGVSRTVLAAKGQGLEAGQDHSVAAGEVLHQLADALQATSLGQGKHVVVWKGDVSGSGIREHNTHPHTPVHTHAHAHAHATHGACVLTHTFGRILGEWEAMRA